MSRLLKTIRAWSGAAALAWSLAAPLAGADDRAAAEALFDRGKRLLDEGRVPDACAAFAESQRLSPAVGTLFNLADCYQRSGRTASAWAEFRSAASLARAKGQTEREDLARERAAALEPTLPRLVLVVPAAAALPGLAVSRDGIAVGSPLWGAPIPVDPGAHRIDATAPGKKAWSVAIEVAPGPEPVTVSIPVLDDAPPPPPVRLDPRPERARPEPPPPESDGKAQRWTGWIVGGVGVAGVAAGAVFGVLAMSKHSESEEGGHCDANDFCDAKGLPLRDDARALGNVSTAFVIGGLALAAGGAALVLTAPRSASRSALRLGRFAF